MLRVAAVGIWAVLVPGTDQRTWINDANFGPQCMWIVERLHLCVCVGVSE